MNYIIDKDQSITHHFKEGDTLNIIIKEHSQGTLSLDIQGKGEVCINISVGSSSNWKILSLNNSNDKLNVSEVITLASHANVHLVYGELGMGDLTKDTQILLEGENAHAELTGAVLTFGSITWSLQADHLARRTSSVLNTNAIILDYGRLRMDVEGKIEKGNRGSTTHQMTRILNLGKQTKGIVFPKLLIDENDVEASHAASVGQVNEEHLFYLQSRGLNKHEALRLMIQGYLAPVIQEIQDKEIREKLYQEIETKVNTYVHES